MNAFETWLKNDFPEADLSRLPSGSYRVQSVRDMERTWLAAYEAGADAVREEWRAYMDGGCR
jgi:hypothetical protein